MKTETETRKELIDAKLYAAGWDVNNLGQVAQEFDISVQLPVGVAEARNYLLLSLRFQKQVKKRRICKWKLRKG